MSVPVGFKRTVISSVLGLIVLFFIIIFPNQHYALVLLYQNDIDFLMKVLRKDIINDFKMKHANSAIPLDNFVATAEKAHVTSPIELKKVFSGVDLWKGWTIINVGGNKYRVIAVVGWKRDQLIIEHVFTHKEYDNWCKKMRKY